MQMWQLPNIGLGWIILSYLYAGLVAYLSVYRPNFLIKTRNISRWPRIKLMRGMVFVVFAWPVLGLYLMWLYGKAFVKRQISRFSGK